MCRLPRTPRLSHFLRSAMPQQPCNVPIAPQCPFLSIYYVIVVVDGGARPPPLAASTAAIPSLVSAATSSTSGRRASFAPCTSATTASRASSSERISSRCRRTSSCSRAFCDCVVWRRALSCDWCAVREGVMWAARMADGGRR